MQIPFSEAELEQRLAEVEAAMLGLEMDRKETARNVQEFGALLFDALISGEVRNRYDVSLSQVEHEGKGLRLKLRVRASDLVKLPWELLFDARRNSYLALSVYTPLVRYLETPQTRKPLTVRTPSAYSWNDTRSPTRNDPVGCQPRTKTNRRSNRKAP